MAMQNGANEAKSKYQNLALEDKKRYESEIQK